MAGFGQLWKEAHRGKSIGRILTNEVLAQWKGSARGLVLDLACGNSPSYRRILELNDNPRVCLVGVDYNADLQPTVVADLKTTLPFKDSIADTVIVSSFIYIVAEPEDFLKETRRVLKPGGLLLLSAPSIYPHVPEPTDYWRFTEETLALLLDRAGFTQVSVIPIGGRWSAAAYLLAPFLRPRWFIAPLAYWICCILDAWTEKRFKIPKCPIGYVVKAKVLT